MSTLNLSDLLTQVKGAKTALEARKSKDNAVKPPPGKSTWRFLPGWRSNEPNKFYHSYGEHWLKNDAGDVLGVVVCERETFGRECECCDAISNVARVLKQNSVDLKDLKNPQVKMLSDMRAGAQTLFNVLRRDGTSRSDVPVLLTLGNSAYSDFLNLLTVRAEEGINLLDLAEGKDINIDRTGTGYDTEYKLTDAGKQTSVDPSVMDKIVDIDAWIESKRQNGLMKANQIPIAAKYVLGSRSSSTMSFPSVASLSPPAASRPAPIIEQNESSVYDDVSVTNSKSNPKTNTKVTVDTVSDLDDNTTAVAKKSTAGKPKEEKTLSDDIFNDEELERILNQL